MYKIKNMLIYLIEIFYRGPQKLPQLHKIKLIYFLPLIPFNAS
jgi:hypothetical protein